MTGPREGAAGRGYSALGSGWSGADFLSMRVPRAQVGWGGFGGWYFLASQGPQLWVIHSLSMVGSPIPQTRSCLLIPGQVALREGAGEYSSVMAEPDAPSPASARPASLRHSVRQAVLRPNAQGYCFCAGPLPASCSAAAQLPHRGQPEISNLQSHYISVLLKPFTGAPVPTSNLSFHLYLFFSISLIRKHRVCDKAHQ